MTVKEKLYHLVNALPETELVAAERYLQADVQRQITAVLDRLAATGYGDVLKLTDSKPPTYRLRVGDWRALLTLPAAVVEVEQIAKRREAY